MDSCASGSQSYSTGGGGVCSTVSSASSCWLSALYGISHPGFGTWALVIQCAAHATASASTAQSMRMSAVFVISMAVTTMGAIAKISEYARRVPSENISAKPTAQRRIAVERFCSDGGEHGDERQHPVDRALRVRKRKPSANTDAPFRVGGIVQVPVRTARTLIAAMIQRSAVSAFSIRAGKSQRYAGG